MIRYFILFLICTFSLNVKAQEQSIDELRVIVNNPSLEDTSRVNAYFELANYYYYQDLDTTIIICNDALALSQKANYADGISEAYGWLGYLYSRKGEPDLALENFNHSLEITIQENDLEGTAQNLNDISTVYHDQGKIEMSLIYLEKCLSVREKIGDQQGVASVLNNLGSIYKRQGDYPAALTYFNRSLKIQKDFDHQIGISTVLSNIGSCYNEMGEIDSSAIYYYEAFIIDSTINNVGGLARGYNNLATLYNADGNDEKALAYFLKAYDYAYEARSREGIASISTSIGNLYYDKGDVKSAKKYAEASLIHAEKLGYPEFISRTAKLLSKIYVKEGNAEMALDMYQLYEEMKDSLNNVSTQQATQKLLAKQEYEKQKIIDEAEHAKKLSQEKAAKEKQTIYSIFLLVGAIILVIFLVFVFNRLKITRKQKNIIETQHEQLEESHQEIKDSIAYAKRIQTAILPSNNRVKEILPNSFVLYLPKDVVAGDFYWMEAIENSVIFAAADCTGHGVPGAIVSVICNNALNRAVREFELTDPGKILDKTRELVIAEFEKSEEEVKDGMDIALCSITGNKLTYAGANNPLWIKKKNGEFVEIKGDKQPIGKYDQASPFTAHSLTLEKGDIIYIFSDGYADQFGGEKGKKLKSKGLRSILDELSGNAMTEQKLKLEAAFNTWKGDLEQLDDVCVIGIEF